MNAQPMDPNFDVQNNKAMGILAYIGILVLVPLFGAKNSKFARFHTGQGLTLAAFEVAYIITEVIINAIVNAIFPWYTFSSVPTVVATILNLGYAFFTVMAVLGIVNAAKGTFKKLPVIGSVDWISRFFEK